MSNLYTLRANGLQLATHFDLEFEAGLAVPEETTPETQGLVVLENEGRRVLRSMRWGFPRPTLEGAIRGEEPKPVNLVANLMSRMWEDLVVEPRYRCLIPLTEFAEPDGEKGKMTRTWFRLKGEPIFAWAGFCRRSEQWGPVFAGMTTGSNSMVMGFNERMPVLLMPGDYDRWLHGTIADVIDFQFHRPLPSKRLDVELTADRWKSGKGPKDPIWPEAQLGLGL
ncbi:DUF159 family protein [Sphingomonas sp. DBB INV C78]|uniref:SOS response-associated peptidase family protein n=1 Tax=Sphingomonas sp. DBB INV C78 TaxID=3349434 RepID=UPI0036D285AA